MGKDNKMTVREKKAAAKKKEELNKKLKLAAIIAIPILVVVLVVVVAIIGKNASTIEMDYSAGLNEDGTIADVKIDDYVELCDYSNIVIPEADVVMTDEDWDAHVTEILEANDLEELTDEFVAENYSEYATTAAGYETYIKELAKSENIKTYVLDYLIENSTVSSMPKDYFELVEENWDAQYQSEYNYYNSLYYQILGYYNWNSYLDYYEMSRSEYKDMVKESTTSAVKQNLVLQAVYEDLGLTITEEDFDEALVEAGYEVEDIDTAVADYGLPYWNQFAICYKVINTVADTATVQ